MNTFLRTDEFDTWLKGLKDQVGKARIIARVISAEEGNFGDVEPVGEGVSEMRIHYGPGYRVYFCRRGKTVTCCYAEALNRHKRKILKRQSVLRAYGWKNEETEQKI